MTLNNGAMAIDFVLQSDSAILADAVVNVALGLFVVDPLLVAAHVEEGLEGVLACRVVWVEVVLFVKSRLRLFDVVENVRRDLLENFTGRRG